MGGGVEAAAPWATVFSLCLARAPATNALAAASMASAPPPPVKVMIAGAVTPDTQLSWTASPGVPAAGYRVHWRDTSEPAWTHARDAGMSGTLALAKVEIDDFAFAFA